MKNEQEQNMKIISPEDIKVDSDVILSWQLYDDPFWWGKHKFP